MLSQLHSANRKQQITIIDRKSQKLNLFHFYQHGLLIGLNLAELINMQWQFIFDFISFYRSETPRVIRAEAVAAAAL